MYEYLRGEIAGRGEGAAVLDVNGIAYRLACSTSTLRKIPPKGPCRLFAHLIVREKDLDRHLKNETAPEAEKDVKKKKEAPAGGEEDFVMESVPKDDKDDIQLQKAISLLKTGDIFANLPPKKPETAEKKDKEKEKD